MNQCTRVCPLTFVQVSSASKSLIHLFLVGVRVYERRKKCKYKTDDPVITMLSLLFLLLSSCRVILQTLHACSISSWPQTGLGFRIFMCRSLGEYHDNSKCCHFHLFHLTFSQFISSSDSIVLFRLRIHYSWLLNGNLPFRIPSLRTIPSLPKRLAACERSISNVVSYCCMSEKDRIVRKRSTRTTDFAAGRVQIHSWYVVVSVSERRLSKRSCSKTSE